MLLFAYKLLFRFFLWITDADIVSFPGLQRQFGVPPADIDRVELDAAGLADKAAHPLLAGKAAFSQLAVFSKEKNTCLKIVYGKFGHLC
jgi:hypothetical protein